MKENCCQLIQVIKSDIERRGDGESTLTPVRVITQYWSTNGDLLAEWDPLRIEIDKLCEVLIKFALSPSPHGSSAQMSAANAAKKLAGLAQLETP